MRIVLLGDVKHNFGENLRQEWSDALGLFDYFFERGVKEILVCRGNHDNFLKTIAGKRNVIVEDYFILGEYCFLHGDRDFAKIYDKEIKCWIIGHAHPAVKLTDKTKVEKYRCFLCGRYMGKNIIVVPSFVEANEGSDPREYENKLAWDFDFEKFEVLVVGENLEVLKFGKLGKLDGLEKGK
jgi:putative SbcD/Mre11-related phosphoesterase